MTPRECALFKSPPLIDPSFPRDPAAMARLLFPAALSLAMAMSLLLHASAPASASEWTEGRATCEF